MTKTLKRAWLIVCVGLLFAILLSGCGVTPAISGDKAVKSALNEWETAVNKEASDIYEFRNVKLQLPLNGVTVSIGARFDIKFKRTVTASSIHIVLTVDGIEIEKGTVLEPLRGVSFENIKDLSVKLVCDFNGEKLGCVVQVTNWGLVSAGASNKIERQFSMDLADTNDWQLIRYTVDQMSVGNVSVKGKYNRKDLTYAYTVNSGNVNFELMRILKVLGDVNSDIEIGQSDKSLSKLLSAVFFTSDIYSIADQYMVQSDMSVSGKFIKGNTAYYFSALSGQTKTRTVIDSNTLKRLIQETTAIFGVADDYSKLIAGAATIDMDLKILSTYIINDKR